EYRLATVVGTLEELRGRLQRYVQGEEVEELYVGEVKRNKEALAVFAADDDLKQAISTWVSKGKLQRLAQLWAKGVSVDWEALPKSGTPRRRSLPTYPFAPERYWMPEPSATASPVGQLERPGWLHPLLQRNTSTLDGQRYSSTFTGEETFFKDHLVQRQRTLPAAAYLEMARAAVAEALDLDPRPTPIRLEDVYFAPSVGTTAPPFSLHIELYEETANAPLFEIYALDSAGQPDVHARGRACVCTAGSDSSPESETLRSQRSGATTPPESRAIVELESDAAVFTDGCVLHPRMLTEALAACRAVSNPTLAREAGGEWLSGLRSIEIRRSFAPRMRVWMREDIGEGSLDGARRIDIDVCDLEGIVCARLHGLRYTQVIPSAQRGLEQASPAEREEGHLTGDLTLVPVWEAVPESGGVR
ncbi:MAG: hypothetical protein ACREUG_06010, partial [Steroidobacteraceae bacterium]